MTGSVSNGDKIKESLSKWNDLCPLKDAQIKSILLLSQLQNSTDSDSVNGSKDDEESARARADSSSSAMGSSHSLQRRHITIENINEDVNELMYNFDVNDVEDPKIERYLEMLNRNGQKCEKLHGLIDKALNHLNVLLDNYGQVSEKTKSLHVACEQLLSDQNKLVNASQMLNSRLSYFTDVEILNQKLSSPIIEHNSEYIIPMLARIDECLSYQESNNNHKESAQYMQTVLQVLRKALQIIKNYTINSLMNTTNQILIGIQQEHHATPSAAAGESTSSPLLVRFSADNAYTLFYSRFRVNSARIKTLMEQLEQRVEQNNQFDYEQALADCHRCYIQQRKMLIWQSVVSAIDEMAKKHARDTCSLVRSSCSFIIHLCQDENQLYNNFFGKKSIFFERYLEELCMILYDRLRPIIIHVVHIETLAELCSILKTEILMENVKTKPDHLSAFEGVCSQMLEDVQERFVYRTHIYIREEILGYNPSPGDLSYPEKLEIMEKIAEKLKQQHMTQSQQGNESDTGSISSTNSELQPLSPGGSNRLSPQDQHGMWFPTLRRTLICLSKLYRCLDKRTFEGLAQETLYMCIQSLSKASEMIKKNKTQNDGDLFLIKHLLILREQISPFNNEFSVVEVQLDFTKLKDAAYGLINKKNKLFQLNRDNAFLDFLLNGTLEAKENLVDSKREVDNQLKRSCEVFIENVSDELFSSIRALIKKIQVVLQMNVDPNAPKVILKQQQFARPEVLHDTIAENYKDIRKKLPLIYRSMSLYLSNRDIEQIILKRVKSGLQQAYLEMTQIVSKNYTDEEQLIIACPTAEQISLWMTVA